MRRDETGGAIYGLLAAIGLMVVLMAVFFASCFSSASGQTNSMGPIVERHHRDGGDRYGDGGGSRGGDNGDGNDQRRCHGARGDCRGSFSPGPFDRSPVEIHDVCISPNCSNFGHGGDGQGQDPQAGEQPR